MPLNEGQKIHREIHSKIHDKIPAKSTHVVKNGVGKSTLQEEGAEMQLFADSWKLPAYSWAFLLTVVFGSFFAYSLSFFPYSGNVCFSEGLKGV